MSSPRVIRFGPARFGPVRPHKKTPRLHKERRGAGGRARGPAEGYEDAEDPGIMSLGVTPVCSWKSRLKEESRWYPTA